MEYLSKALKAVEDLGLYPIGRSIEEVPYPELVIGGRRYLCLCSNNCLGLSVHPEVKKAAIEGALIGLTVAAARERLTLLAIPAEAGTAEDAAIVTGQVPDAGSILPRGGSVTLTVS